MKRRGSPWIKNKGLMKKLKGLIRMQFLRFRKKLILGFHVFRILDASIHGTHRNALLLVVKAHALGALISNDVVVLLGEGRMGLAVQLVILTAGVNRFVGALGFASTTIDAFLVDGQWHGIRSSAI
jgi:hypothetical protein